MYKTVLVADFFEPKQCVGDVATAAGSGTNRLLYMNQKPTNAFPYIGRNGTNTILYMGRPATNALSYRRRRATNAILDMPASAVAPTQFRTCANGMRHHAG